MKPKHTQNHPAAGSRPSLAELHAMGKSLRKTCPRSSHAVWKAPDNRPDPLQLLEQSNEGRIPELIPKGMLDDLKRFVKDGLPDPPADLLDAHEQQALLVRAQALADYAHSPEDRNGHHYPWLLV